jgi:hypothetical protein
LATADPPITEDEPQLVEAFSLSAPGHRDAAECDVGEAVPSAAAGKNFSSTCPAVSGQMGVLERSLLVRMLVSSDILIKI